MTPDQIRRLKQYLVDNDATYGAMTNQQVADALNLQDISSNKASLTGDEILAQIEPAALATLSGDNAVKVMGIVGMQTVDPFGPAAQVFIDAFGGGSTTITNLQAARVENISLAQQENFGAVDEAAVAYVRSGG